jgi:hypothetical protein
MDNHTKDSKNLVIEIGDKTKHNKRNLNFIDLLFPPSPFTGL